MKNKINPFLIISIIMLIVGNIVSLIVNKRFLHLTTNVVFIILGIFTFITPIKNNEK